MPANAEVTRPGFDSSGYSPRSASMTDANNPHYHSVEWRSQRDPDYEVYVYNLSARTFEDPSGRGIIGRINLRAPGITDEDRSTVGIGRVSNGKPEKVVEGDSRWHFVTSFPQPVLISKFNDESEQISYVETDAIRFIVDQINPDNPTRSLATKLPDSTAFPRSQGNDFSQKGVFFSLSDPPLKDDLEPARKRMETYYTQLLDQAAALELSDEKTLSEQLRANPDYGYAANYYGRTFKWNRKNVRTTECSNCGEQKPANRMFHTASWGLCVERTQEAWKAVTEAGVRTRDAVPPEFKWWADEEKAAKK